MFITAISFFNLCLCMGILMLIPDSFVSFMKNPSPVFQEKTNMIAKGYQFIKHKLSIHHQKFQNKKMNNSRLTMLCIFPLAWGLRSLWKLINQENLSYCEKLLRFLLVMVVLLSIKILQLCINALPLEDYYLDFFRKPMPYDVQILKTDFKEILILKAKGVVCLCQSLISKGTKSS